MTKRDAYRDSRDKAGLSGTRPAGQAVAEPGRTGTALFRGCPVVPPCDAPMMGISVKHSGGSLSGRPACGGGEPRNFDHCSKIGMEPRGACCDAFRLSGPIGSPEATWRLLR